MASPSTTGIDANPAGPSSGVRAADKWVKPNGPPVGVTFGARRITDDTDLWSQNAWYISSPNCGCCIDDRDHVTLPEDYLEKAKEIYDFQRSHPVAEDKRGTYRRCLYTPSCTHCRWMADMIEKYNAEPAKYWDSFYKDHQAA